MTTHASNQKRSMLLQLRTLREYVSLLTLGSCFACAGSDGVSGTDAGAMTGGNTAIGSGGSTHTGGVSATGGVTSVAGNATTGGTSGAVQTSTTMTSCGSQGCPTGEVCEDLVWIPNFGPRTDTYSCKTNPCGSSPLSCTCAASICNGFTCGISSGYVTCTYMAVCASPDTPIATPAGERPIADIKVGDLVYSVEHDTIRAVPVARIGRHVAERHRVVRVHLSSGSVLEISASHPTADGRMFGDLRHGDELGGLSIGTVETVPYTHEYTYDILPASSTGYYFAGGAMIGSTLTPILAELHCDSAHSL